MDHDHSYKLLFSHRRMVRDLRRLLSRLVEKRFGELPALVGTRLRTASLEELESWTDALMDATSLDDVIGCVQPRRTDN